MKLTALKMALLRGASALVLAWAPACIGDVPGALAWPEPFIAPDARLSSVGEHININGIPARIYRYITDSSQDEVIRYFRSHVERDFSQAPSSASLAGQLAVAGRVGDFWVTLQLKRESGETVGTWSAMPQFVPGIRETVQRPPGFPAAAKLIQQVDSFDDDKRSQMAVGVDTGPVDGVAARLEEELRGQGFAKQITPRSNWPSPSVYVAIFRKSREEVLVTLTQEAAGTSVMINRISALEEFK